MDIDSERCSASQIELNRAREDTAHSKPYSYKNDEDETSNDDDDDSDSDSDSDGDADDENEPEDDKAAFFLPKVLYILCPYASCKCPTKKSLTLDKKSPKATATAYHEASKKKILKDGFGGTTLDISTEEACIRGKSFAKAYGHSPTAINEANKFLREHYKQWRPPRPSLSSYCRS
jgi:hypothetical protein